MNGGFYEQRRFSPTGLGVVAALHAAAITALALAPPTVFKRPEITKMFATQIPLPDDPPPVPPPPTPQIERPQPQPSRMETAETIIDLPINRPTVAGPVVPQPTFLDPIGVAGSAGAGDVPELPPLRVEAQFDPRAALQPDYPAAEQRAQRNGSVRLRVTIGADGRVKAVERLSATSDAFWRATERHALSRWRFRPATLDGRPVESVKVLTVHFRIGEV